MKKVIRLTESELISVIKKVISEQSTDKNKVEYPETIITNKNCLKTGDVQIVANNYDALVKKGFKCVGRRYQKATGKPEATGKAEMDDIILKKDINCGLAVKTLYVNIATKNFSTLTKVGDLDYYVKGFGEGETDIKSIDYIIEKIKNSCIR
jgi:hypothetical protein